jgi:hypothetical protein
VSGWKLVRFADVADWAAMVEAVRVVAVGDRWAPACGLCPFVGVARWLTAETARDRSVQHVGTVHREARPPAGRKTGL